MITRRNFLMVAATSGGAILLAACGGGTAAPAASQPPASSPAQSGAASTPASAAAASSAQASAASRAAGPIKLKLGQGGGIGLGMFNIASTQGFYKNNDLDVELRSFASNADAVTALVAGDIDGVHPSAQLINTMLDRNIDIKVIAVDARNKSGTRVIGPAAVGKAQDLKGKKVAMVAGTESEYTMTLYLKTAGLTMKDVQVVKAEAPEIVALVARGDADAFALWEPFPTNALSLMGDKVKVLAVSWDLGSKSTNHVVMANKFLQANPEGGQRIIKTYLDTEKFIAGNANQAVDILAKANKLEVAQAQPLFEKVVFNVVVDQDMLTEIKTLGEWLKEQGTIKTVPDYSKAIDSSYLQKLDPSRVTLKL